MDNVVIAIFGGVASLALRLAGLLTFTSSEDNADDYDVFGIR